MPRQTENDYVTPRQRAWSLLGLLGFGLLALLFLVAIDRLHWFHIRPISGTAAAMSHASDMPSR